jgi:cytochrome c oxidase assembly protein subunit 11
MSEELEQKNSKLVKRLILLAVLMFGFGFALVPLYDVLCDITGQNTVVENSALSKTEYVVDESRESKHRVYYFSK